MSPYISFNLNEQAFASVSKMRMSISRKPYHHREIGIEGQNSNPSHSIHTQSKPVKLFKIKQTDSDTVFLRLDKFFIEYA